MSPRQNPALIYPATDPIRLLLVHDRPLVREGLCAIIAKEPGIILVGATANLAEAISIIDRETPDLLLVDVDREGKEDGLGLVGALLQNSKGTPILLLAGLSDNVDEISGQAISLGASGLVLKQQGTDVLIKAIKKVHEGEAWFDRSTVARMLRERVAPLDSEASKISSLTAREREVLALVAEGLKNKQIAERLFISEITVTHHLSSIFSKLGVSDRLELVLYSLSHRLVSTKHQL